MSYLWFILSGLFAVSFLVTRWAEDPTTAQLGIVAALGSLAGCLIVGTVLAVRSF